MKKYSKEIKEFIAQNVNGMTTRALVELVNAKFGTDFTESRMKSYKKNNNLKSGTRCGVPAGLSTKKYPEEVREFIMNNYIGVGHQGMVDLLNQTFGTAYTKGQIKSLYARWKLNSGRTGRFPKGGYPIHAVQKGEHISPETEFKKGHRPHNQLPISTEILRQDGYVWVKIANPNKWRQKHVLIWEAANGPKPEKHVVLFADGNRFNFDPNNLVLISQAQLVRLNQKHLIQNDADLTKTGIIIADIYNKIGERKRKK